MQLRSGSWWRTSNGKQCFTPNIIEQIKKGEPAEAIRKRFQELGLLPGATLPNPNIPALMQKAFDKLSAYRRALVEVVKKYGSDLLNELNFELEHTVESSDERWLSAFGKCRSLSNTPRKQQVLRSSNDEPKTSWDLPR